MARRGIGIRLGVKMEKVKKLFTMYELVLCRYVGLFTHSQLCSQRDLRRQKAY